MKLLNYCLNMINYLYTKRPLLFNRKVRVFIYDKILRVFNKNLIF